MPELHGDLMSQGVDRLKELLFDTEARKLDELNRRLQLLADAEMQHHGELARRVDAVFERAGTEDRLRKSVAIVLDGALRDAEVDRHSQLSEAVAPIVVTTIKTELRNSQDEMVDALYPITGRLVKQYVAAAVKDMMVQINSRLSVGFPGRRLAMQAKSVLTGTSMSELALAETQRLALEELFLIRRGSGELIAHWEVSDEPKGAGDRESGTAVALSNRDALIPPYLVAINAFAEDAFAADAEGMRALDMGDSRIYLRSSVAYLLAAKCTGTGPAAVERAIDEQFLATLDEYQSALAIPPASPSLPGRPAAKAMQSEALGRLLPSLARKLDHKLAEKHAELAPSGSGSFAPLYTLAALILLPLLALGGWTTWQNWQTARTREAVQAVLGSMPEVSSYPLQIDVDRGGTAYTVTGLAPSIETRDRLRERLRSEVNHAEMRDRIAAVAVATGPAADPAVVAALRRTLTEVEVDLWRAPIRRSIDRAATGLGDVSANLARLAPALYSDVERGELARIVSALKSNEPGIGELQRGLASAAVGRAALVAPLTKVSEFLGQIETGIVAMSGGPPSLSRPMTKATDAVEIAEQLPMQVERLALLVATLERTLPLRPLPGQLTALRQRLDNLKFPEPAQPRERTVRERLGEFVRDHAIFFSNNTDYLDERQANQILDDFATLVKAADVMIRVVGFTDERGSQARNSTVATQRAQRVATDLATRGLPTTRIVVLGRPGGFELYPGAGPGSPNRRVEFEIGFVGEPGPP